MRKLTTLLLITAVLAALAAPHPCAAEHQEHAGQPGACHAASSASAATPAATPAACHATAAGLAARQPACHHAARLANHLASPAHRPLPAKPAKDCCDTLCQNACHMLALAGMAPVRLAALPAAAAPAVVLPPVLSPFASAIDHIPLA